MKIFIISDNDWVKESVEKYLDFKNVIKTSSEIEDVNDVYDYIFVDMQVKSNGGPSLISCLLYTSPSPRDQRGSGMPACA